MTKIHHLSAAVIAKIAAGEVIERPSYVVKELMENALDAGATGIHIDVEEYGFRRIVVTDNGEGMEKEDVVLCVQPHTTSKLGDTDEVVGITTLGFRGEALSSIAAVSQLTIQSKRRDAVAGTQLQYRSGASDIRSIAMAAGTKVIVEYLFAHMPARKKFLKRQTTEWRHIADMVTEIALGHPQVRFCLTHNGRQIVDLAACRNVSDRIREVVGLSVSQELLPVSYEDSYLKITGFVSKPSLVTYTHHKQYLFANTRSIRDRKISLAVKEAFGDLLDPTAYPLCVLFLTVPANVTDVNIHPRKEEIVFLEQRFIFDVVQRAVMVALSHHTRLPVGEQLPETSQVPTGALTTSYAAGVLKDAVLPANSLARTQVTRTSIVMQIHNTYIVVPTKTGFLLIDQHAAHERILYEQFSRAWQTQKKKQELFLLPTPVMIDVSVADGQVINDQKAFFETAGFQLESLGSTSFLLSAVPILLQDRQYASVVRGLIEDLREEYATRSVDLSSKRMMNSLACRSAVKAGDPLTRAACKQLVAQLQSTPNHVTCPHGRPTFIEITADELKKWFKRK